MIILTVIVKLSVRFLTTVEKYNFYHLVKSKLIRKLKLNRALKLSLQIYLVINQLEGHFFYYQVK